MIDTDRIEDVIEDLLDFDKQVRKSLAVPEGVENPAQVISTLTGLARVASSTAQALAAVLSNARERELLEARLRARA